MRVPADKISLPIPDLDDKTFDELFLEARALIPRYAPEWTDHNTSDPGITFIELFAWLTEMQIYSLNRINDRHIIKYLKLLGEQLQPAKPAIVNLAFSLNNNSNNSVSINKGTQTSVIDPVTDLPLVFETNSDLTVTNNTIAHLFVDDSQRLIDITGENKDNGVFAFVFGEKAIVNSTFYIALTGAEQFPDAEIKLFYTLFDADLPRLDSTELYPDIIASALVEWQYWNGSSWSTVAVVDDTVAFTRSGPISFQGHQSFKKTSLKTIIPGAMHSNQDEFYWLRAVLKESDYEIPPRINTLNSNTVTALQTQTVSNEFINPIEIVRRGLPFQNFSLKNKPVLVNTLKLEIKEQNQTWLQWDSVADFDTARANDRVYMIDLEAGSIRFGDGIKGRIPAQGENKEKNIRASYNVGGGERGNVKAQTLHTLQSSVTTMLKVTNPAAAFGGTPAESLLAAQNRIRQDLKQAYRSVNCDDFIALAFKTPGLRIQRVKVLPLYHPDYPVIKMPGAVTVLIVPYKLTIQSNLPVPSKGFLKTIYNYLEPRRLVATQLFVIAPKFIKIDINIGIEIDPRKSAEILSRNIHQAVNNFLDPVTGGPDGNGWPFGRDVYRSELFQVLQNIEGVNCVSSVELTADKCFRNSNGNIVIPKIGLVYAGDIQVTIKGEQTE